jgi:hypothetical protein
MKISRTQLHKNITGILYIAEKILIYYIIYFQSKDEEYLEMLIQQEKHDSEIRRQIADEEEKREKNTKLKNNEALIDELVFFIS